MVLTRRVTFSSGHRYWFNEMSAVENRRIFGEWASQYNHGHNYVLEASISGGIDSSTGMVINIKVLDGLLKDRIVSRLDQKSINDEVEEFRDWSPTLENLSRFAWNQLTELPEGARAIRVRLFETPDLWAEYRGPEQDMTITRMYEFCASHRLFLPDESDAVNTELFGKCTNPNGHGHNYELEVTVAGSIDERSGMSVDLAMLDAAVTRQVVDRYDHKNLNLDIEEFADRNPTSEVITREIWKRLVGTVPGKLKRVVLRETPRNIFEYEGEDES